MQPSQTSSRGFSSDFAQLGSQLAGVDHQTFTDWRWQMSQQIISPATAKQYVHLSPEESDGFGQTQNLFQSGVPPYYMTLIHQLEKQGIDTQALRLQVIPRIEEVASFGEKDPRLESPHSPVKEVVHVYPDRVAFCVAQLCPVYCRYCFRKRRDEEQGLHFNRRIIEKGVAYIASQPAIRDVLITGGDPFIASDQAIEGLLQKLRKIKHVEIIRFGTRTPVALPYRITENLTRILAKYHPIWLNTHFNHALELSHDSMVALERLSNAGIPLGNQSVLLKGVNDSYDSLLTLNRKLLQNRVRPYYLFHPHKIAGTQHLQVTVENGLKIVKKLRGNITGFGIPVYILDTPSGKIPLPDRILGRDQTDLILENSYGEIWREKGVN